MERSDARRNWEKRRDDERFDGRSHEKKRADLRLHDDVDWEETRHGNEEEGWMTVAHRRGGREKVHFDILTLTMEDEKGEGMKITVTTGEKRSFIKIPSAACSSFLKMKEQALNAKIRNAITRELWWRDSQHVITVFQSWRRECKIVQFRDKQVLARIYLPE